MAGFCSKYLLRYLQGATRDAKYAICGKFSSRVTILLGSETHPFPGRSPLLSPPSARPACSGNEGAGQRAAAQIPPRHSACDRVSGCLPASRIVPTFTGLINSQRFQGRHTLTQTHTQYLLAKTGTKKRCDWKERESKYQKENIEPGTSQHELEGECSLGAQSRIHWTTRRPPPRSPVQDKSKISAYRAVWGSGQGPQC